MWERRGWWCGDKKEHCQIVSLPKGATSSPWAPAWGLTMTFIHTTVTKEQSRRPCLNTNHLPGPSQLSAKMRLSFVAWLFHYVPLCRKRLMLFLFFIPFQSWAPGAGLADLKHWWSSDSTNWAQRYIFIMLESASKTLSLVLKLLDGSSRPEVDCATQRLVILKADCGSMWQLSICFHSASCYSWQSQAFSVLKNSTFSFPQKQSDTFPRHQGVLSAERTLQLVSGRIGAECP